jgi:hypothetical protein
MTFHIYRQISRTGFVEPEAVQVLNGRWLVVWTIIEPDETIETRWAGP